MPKNHSNAYYMLSGSAIIIILQQACRLDLKWAQYNMQAVFNYQYDEEGHHNLIVSWLVGLSVSVSETFYRYHTLSSISLACKSQFKYRHRVMVTVCADQHK